MFLYILHIRKTMQQILNVLTLNNIDYVRYGDFGSVYYIINVSDTCQIKLEYLWNKQNKKYIKALSLIHISNNKELEKANNIINLISPFLN